MTFRTSFIRPSALISSILVLVCIVHIAGGETSTTNQIASASSEPTIPVGIDGVYRAGQWTAIRRPESLTNQATVQTLDGSGVKVNYDQPVNVESPFLYAVPGSIGVPLVIADAAGNEVYRGRFSGKSIEPKMPWVVTIGDTLGIEAIGRNDLLNRESSVAVSVIHTASDLPDHPLGLSSVDLIILGPSSIDMLAKLSPHQGHAIAEWVRYGGRVMLSLGKDSNAIFTAAPWLKELLPFTGTLKTIRLDPSAIETYTSSQTPLPVLEAADLPAREGETRIAGRNAARQSARIAVEYVVGFGRVTVVAAALDSPELAAWPQRTLLVTRLSHGLFASEFDSRRDARGKATVAYDDIAGQVRAALDRFDSRRRIPYSIISVILIALVALIGPLDYLLVNRLLGRPLLGWVSFPLSVLLISALMVMIGRPAVSSDTQHASLNKPAHINRIEIVDIDATKNEAIGRGWSWSHLSSIDATKTDYPARLVPTLFDPAAAHGVVSAPFGYPGPTFGGISIAGEDTRMPSYQVSMKRDVSSGYSSDISNIPIPPGGSKGIVTRWTFTPNLSTKSDLRRRRGSELLEGRVTNPLPVDLLNGALVFGEWVYMLPTRLRAGQSIDDIETLRQKNFRWLLARREALENSSRSEPWNVEMVDDFPRLVEVLMFDSVVGGHDYTGLANRPLADLDLSYLLTKETAILYGQLENPALEIDLPVQRGSASAIRVMLPVASPRLSSSPQ